MRILVTGNITLKKTVNYKIEDFKIQIQKIDYDDENKINFNTQKFPALDLGKLCWRANAPKKDFAIIYMRFLHPLPFRPFLRAKDKLDHRYD